MYRSVCSYHTIPSKAQYISMVYKCYVVVGLAYYISCLNLQTHPTQSCFMSSIDLHTQYAYQILLPEAIAIVMAPKDGSR
ncbi:hypothetical protein GW17_00039589 [Ensete ventricosum]|nr:hypothetical protein GW17_00039589 [Ensete ventricosum]